MDARLSEIPKGYGCEVDVATLVTQSMGFEEAKEAIVEYCSKHRVPGVVEKANKDMVDLIDSLIKATEMFSLVIVGQPGTGKSFVTQECLMERGMAETRDFIVISGFITPLEFYKLAYDFKDKLIVVDDTESVLANEDNLNMLLHMTWSNGARRRVTYASSTTKLDGRELYFDFNGKVIILTNHLPRRLKSAAFDSRTYTYSHIIPRETRLEMMETIARRTCVPLEIVDFIRNSTTEDTPNVDFRLLTKLKELYTTNNERWKELGLKIMRTTDEESLLVIELAASKRTVGEQFNEYKKRTGHGRTCFFNKRKALGLEVHKGSPPRTSSKTSKSSVNGGGKG